MKMIEGKFRLVLLLFIALFLAKEANSQTPITYGETITGTISVDGKIDTYTFSGSSGDIVIIRMTESTYGSSEQMEPYVELYNPTGQLIADSSDASQVNIFMELPATGTYTILASDTYPGDDYGNYAIFIQRSFDPGLADTLDYGETVAADISTEGDIDTYTFSGSAGDKVIIRMTESTYGSSEQMEPYVELYNPTGQLIADSSDASQVSITYNLQLSGYYTILASDSYPGDDVGNYAVFLMGFEGSNTENDILSFSVGKPPQTGDAIIDLVSHTVIIEVENGTDVTDLIAAFTLSDGATATVGGVLQASDVNSNDFTNPVTYVITAEDGVTVQDWIVTIDIATGINENSIRNVNIYPNPFYSKTIIEFINPNHSNYKLSVFSISGNKVFEMYNITSDKIELKKGNLPIGVYIVELKGEIVFKNKMIIIK